MNFAAILVRKKVLVCVNSVALFAFCLKVLCVSYEAFSRIVDGKLLRVLPIDTSNMQL